MQHQVNEPVNDLINSVIYERFFLIQVLVRWAPSEQPKEFYAELDGAVSRYHDADEYRDGARTRTDADRKVSVSFFSESCLQWLKWAIKWMHLHVDIHSFNPSSAWTIFSRTGKSRLESRNEPFTAAIRSPTSRTTAISRRSWTRSQPCCFASVIRSGNGCFSTSPISC